MSKTFEVTFYHGTVTAKTLITVDDSTLPEVARHVAKRKIVDVLLASSANDMGSETVEVQQ